MEICHYNHDVIAYETANCTICELTDSYESTIMKLNEKIKSLEDENASLSDDLAQAEERL